MMSALSPLPPRTSAVAPAPNSGRAASALLAYRRRELERWIEEAIALLDTIDGNPDIEDDDREPEETDQNGDEGHEDGRRHP